MIPLLWPALAVAAGAFFGGALRGLLRHRPGGLRGTWTANISASLLLGMVLAVWPSVSPWQLALGTGFCGALSTWSTLAGELGSLLRERSWRRLLRYLGLTLGAGLSASWMGWHLAALLFM